MIRKKRNGKHIHPVCKLPWTNLLMYFPYTPYPHTSGPHFMATNIKSFRENWIRAPFFIYLFFLFLLCLLHTYLLTLSMFFTPWIIYEKYVAFPYFHSLTVAYPYWRYVPICTMYHSVKVICKCVTDTSWKISLCKWHVRSTSGHWNSLFICI